MASQYGIDVGNVLSRVEAIKEARVRNQFLQPQLEADLQGRQQNNQLNGMAIEDEVALRGARGDPGKMSLIDPAKASQLQSFLDGADDKKKAEIAETVDKIGKGAAYVLGKPEEERADAYLEYKSLLSPEIQKSMPATYDETWMEAHLAEAMEIDDLVKAAKPAAGDLTKDAPSGYMWTDETRSKLKPVEGGPHDPKSKGGGGLETAAANGIRSTAALAFGGEFDPNTGEFSLLDPNEVPKMMEVVARAQEIVAEDSAIVPGRAVQMAIEEVGGGGGDGEGGNAMAGGATEADPAKPATQEDYDALPSGAYFINPADGKLKQKP